MVLRIGAETAGLDIRSLRSACLPWRAQRSPGWDRSASKTLALYLIGGELTAFTMGDSPAWLVYFDGVADDRAS
jgi:hypothetical protein